MMARLASLFNSTCDATLGWMLDWPRDWAVLVLALVTVGLMLLIRHGLVQSARMNAVLKDMQHLKRLIRDSRMSGNQATIQRHRRNQIRVIGLKVLAELPAVIVSILLFAGLVNWGASRLGHLPLKPGRTFEFQLSLPASAAGRIVHVVPLPGLSAEGGWIKTMQREFGSSRERAIAMWTLRGEAGSYSLLVRGTGTAVSHPLIIGSARSQVAVVDHSSIGTTRIGYMKYYPFGRIRGLPAWGLEPWLCGYLLVLIPGYLGLKRAFTIR